jgi:hypothetical protein
MPKLQRSDVPEAVIRHLARRVREREFTVQDVQAFARWLDKNPTVPDGDWFKRFVEMTAVGRGSLVLTLLKRTQTAVGEEL